MLNSVVHAFSVSFPHPIEELWAVVSDTNRLNELVENPKYDAYEVLRDDGVVDVYGRLPAAGFVVEWLEVPVNWIENPWFEQVRRFLGRRFELPAQRPGLRSASVGAYLRRDDGAVLFQAEIQRSKQLPPREFQPMLRTVGVGPEPQPTPQRATPCRVP